MRKPIWNCKVGMLGNAALPNDADYPMRMAISKAYSKVVGVEPQFIFSGWSSSLTESELAVVENRMPDPAKVNHKSLGLKEEILRKLDEKIKVYTVTLRDQELSKEAEWRYLGAKVALEDLREYVAGLPI